MTHQIWTRIIIASLILLGDGALASEISQRSNVETIPGNNTALISYSDAIDNSDPTWHPLFTSSNFKHNRDIKKYQTLATLVGLNTSPTKYKLYHSRAPPVSF